MPKGMKWAKDAKGRKINSESMTKRLLEGKVGRAFETKHGLSQTPEYNHWKKMMARCYKEHNPDYPNYGGRGIVVCDRWHSVANFVEDMGKRPDLGGKRVSVERVDVNGNYEPTNCVWLPLSMQAKNRRPWRHTTTGLKNISVACKKTNAARDYSK